MSIGQKDWVTYKQVEDLINLLNMGTSTCIVIQIVPPHTVPNTSLDVLGFLLLLSCQVSTNPEASGRLYSCDTHT